MSHLLGTYRQLAVTEREKGTYFEDLILCYLRNEATYRDLYARVWTYADWAREQGQDARDTGIDLVAETTTGDVHAIQCKLYAAEHRLQKKDIDSFFTASGKRPFVHRVIVCSTDLWSEHAEDALRDQQPPVSKIDLHDLENSQIDWTRYQPQTEPVLKPRKDLLLHQESALKAVAAGLKDGERGKLIMACGTGKTFAGLKIAEAVAGRGKRVLFLVPSLSLLSQTLTEWSQQSANPLHSFAVCSDSHVGKRRRDNDDEVQTFIHELRYPATTNAKRLAGEMARRHDAQHMSVVFSTYHSIDVVSRAQQEFGLADFDLIICDEAHRTTGATFGDDDESNFVRVHDAEYIRGTKRLYMTATPRIYGDSAKASAERDNVALCSMDDETMFGKQLYVLTFSEAVKRNLLVDYKVIVLAVEESHVNARLQRLLASDDNQLKVDDAAKIVGCWKALAKQGLSNDLIGDDNPMQRAVAFCQVIDPPKNAKVHKVSSTNIAGMFQTVVEEYQKQENVEPAARLICEAKHVDGGMNASAKEGKLEWLKAEVPPQTCRVLSNVRCLSEGVDVPALDAVLFLTPRNSQVDVVQSVGRVMRKAEGKRRGYVILPVVIPAGVTPEDALNDNKTYSVVWQVLQALRSHDDRFDAMVNKMEWTGNDPRKMEVIAITDKVQRKAANARADGAANRKMGRGGYTVGEAVPQFGEKGTAELTFEIGEIERAIYAKVVKKCGNRHHWEDWANDIAKIARTHIDRIRAILASTDNVTERGAFDAFAEELRDDLNPSLTDDEIVEMLAQHLITKPVFDALFSGYSFAQHNPMSRAMQAVLDSLQEHRLEKEADTLEAFYESVRQRAEGIDSATGKQKIVVELYEKFFRNAFPKMTERLGIVYTPVEVVDFILHSVAHLLQIEFGQTLGSKGVHILDPFTGTGTFVTRLLQSGLINQADLLHKYKHEIHANEIVLLAYYIAAINIEATFHGLVGGDYVPFEGICLTDTFQMYEREDLVDQLLVDNSKRRKRQKKLDIRVIVGNPPYSVGQKSANDNAKNVPYEGLRRSLQRTYIERSTSNARSVYDTYILALKWATERLDKTGNGVIGFVSGNGFIDKPAMDGVRRCLKEDFNSLYIINLRGDVRKNMLSQGRAKEGGNIFESGSMTGIAISLLVKNSSSRTSGSIRYFDIGDDLSSKEKRSRLEQLGSIEELSKLWIEVEPNDAADWINRRSDKFAEFIAIGDKQGREEKTIFKSFSLGLTTNRDAWCVNSSRDKVVAQMKDMIDFYDEERVRFNASGAREPDEVISLDETKISWSYHLKKRLQAGKTSAFLPGRSKRILYRPFTKQWVYFDRVFNEYVYQTPRLFGDGDQPNIAIVVSGVGARSGFSALVVDSLFSGDMIEKGQGFPKDMYESTKLGEGDATGSAGLFAGQAARPNDALTVDAISDEGLRHFQSAYAGVAISKEDLFYYVYGLLHSPEYRARFADSLSKELPRITPTKAAADFWAFSKAGRALAELHLNFEAVEKYPLSIDANDELTDANYRVEKMKFAKKKDLVTGKNVDDRSTVIYNARITLRGIPEDAWDYVVNGKAALDWVMERQAVRIDKASGIVNDANDWATETMGNPRYPLELFQRVITVSLETLRIVRSLPRLDT